MSELTIWADDLLGAHPAAHGPPKPETLAFVRHWLSLCPHGSQVKFAYCIACVAALLEFEVEAAKSRWAVEFRAQFHAELQDEHLERLIEGLERKGKTAP